MSRARQCATATAATWLLLVAAASGLGDAPEAAGAERRLGETLALPTVAPLPTLPPALVLPGMIVLTTETETTTSTGEAAETEKKSGKDKAATASEHSHLRKAGPKTRTTEEPTTTKTTTATATTTTSTTNTCSSTCVVNKVAASCKDHIQQSSLNDFLGDMNSCKKAQANIAAQCEVCGGCPAHEAGCGVLELPPTVPPTTTIPAGGTCEAICELGGQKATCKNRVLWSADHIFYKGAGSCSKAHTLVLGQCAVCSKCEVEKTKCTDPTILAAEAAKKKAEQQGTFDCKLDLDTWRQDWSDAKKTWCCEHKDAGCEEHADDGAAGSKAGGNEVVFKQKFDADVALRLPGRAAAPGASPAERWRSGLCMLAGCVSLFAGLVLLTGRTRGRDAILLRPEPMVCCE